MTPEEKQAERERLQRMLDASERMQSEGGFKERIEMIKQRLADLGD